MDALRAAMAGRADWDGQEVPCTLTGALPCPDVMDLDAMGTAEAAGELGYTPHVRTFGIGGHW